MCNCIAARLPRYRSAEGRILICRAAYGLAAANPCHAVGVGISRSADRCRGELPLLVVAVGRAHARRIARIGYAHYAPVAVVQAVVAIDKVSVRVPVIYEVRQRRPVAAACAEVIRLRHHAAYCLAAQLVRALIRVGHGDARVLNSRIQA